MSLAKYVSHIWEMKLDTIVLMKIWSMGLIKLPETFLPLLKLQIHRSMTKTNNGTFQKMAYRELFIGLWGWYERGGVGVVVVTSLSMRDPQPVDNFLFLIYDKSLTVPAKRTSVFTARYNLTRVDRLMAKIPQYRHIMDYILLKNNSMGKCVCIFVESILSETWNQIYENAKLYLISCF